MRTRPMAVAFRSKNKKSAHLNPVSDVISDSGARPNTILRAAMLCALAAAAAPALTHAKASEQMSEQASDPTVRAAAASEQASDAASATKPFNIDDPKLSRALIQLTQQAGLQLIYPAQDNKVENLPAKPVVGQYTTEGALERLLQGSGLRYEFLDDRTIAIVNPSADTAKLFEGGSGARGERGSFIRLAQTENSGSTHQGDNEGDSKESTEEAKLEEIVVTAQKREEKLQETPISIAVLNGEKLDASTSRGLAEELNLVPGVAITTYGQAEATQVVIRGVATAALFSGTSNVGYYVDGAPFAFIRQGYVPDLTPFDLERVEVLRGPQGTLYGAGAMSGVVNILTHDPDLDAFDLKIRGILSSTKYGGLNYGGDAAANIPIIPDRLAMRLVVSDHKDAGWIDAPLTGEEDRNDGKRNTYRLKIAAQPTDQLKLDFSAWLTRNFSGAPALSRANRQQELVTTPEPIDVDYENYVFTVGYDFQSFALTSTTSHIDYQLESVLDLTTIGLAGLPLQTNFGADSSSQEVNLASTTDGPWSWNLGFFYRDALENLVSILLPFADNDLDYTSESYAVYGELTRSFLDDRLRMTVGLRYFDDHATFEETKPFNFDTSRPLTTGEGDFRKLTGRAVLTWLPNEDLTIYASYGQGYRSGLLPDAFALLNSFGNAPSADPDFLANYEIGAKGSLFGGRLNYDTAVYYIDWKNYRSSIVAEFCPVNGSTCLQTGYLGNFGQASGFGAEGALSAELLDGLTLGANLSWNGLQLESFNVRPDDSPEWTAGGSIDYSFPLGSSGVEGVFSTSANYQSKKKSAFGGETGTTFSDPYFFSRASFTLNWPDHWSLSIFADNITDEYRVTQRGDPGRPDWDSRQRPRTIGLQLQYN